MVRLQEPSEAHGQITAFREEHFTEEPPEDCGLSAEDYQRYKQSLLGTPIPKQRTSDEMLRALGYDDWTQYCVEGIPYAELGV